MTARILLVTGSRALADTPAAEAWARDKLRAALDWWEPTLIVHGGCPRSPDVWAVDRADRVAEVFYADGRRVLYDEWDAVRSAGSWLLPGDHAHPLLRNTRMVAAVTTRVRAGADVLVVGLTAPWARTHGTEYTLARAAGYGLRSIARACPAELGPVRRC